MPNAKKAYEELYAIYHQINDSKLEPVHKEVAYQQLVQSYHSISDLKQQITAPTNIIAVAIVIVILSVIIFVNPRIVGLAVFQEIITQPLALEFAQSGAQELLLKEFPSSFSASGQFKGEGTARLYAEIDGRRLLVFDSTKSKIGAEKFKEQCMDTCTMPKVRTKKVILSAEINDAILTIDKITYYTKKTKNNAPEWGGGPNKIAINGQTTIDLEQHFTDKEGDELVYLARTPPGIKAEVSGSKVTITPETSEKGVRVIDVIVSDLKQTTRAKIELDLQ